MKSIAEHHTFIVAAVSFIALLFSGVFLNAQDKLPCNKNSVAGQWKGSNDTDPPWNISIDVAFQFNPDGTYTYSAGQGRFVWLSHQGTYSITQSQGEESRTWPCRITLTPIPATAKVNPDNKLGLMPLHSRNLMDDQKRTFRLSGWGNHLSFMDTELSWRDVGMFGVERP